MGPLYVYKVTNRVNGKVYVGQTSRRHPEQRWREHLKEARKGRRRYPLYLAIRKYGADNFSFRVLAEYDGIDECNQGERDYVKQFRSTVHEHGYNIAPGGRGISRVPALDAAMVAKLRQMYATGKYTYWRLAKEAGCSIYLAKSAVRGRHGYARIGRQLPRNRFNRVQRPAHAHKELRALSPRDAAEMRREYRQGQSTADIARRRGLSKSLVKRAVFGREGYANFDCNEPPAEFVSYALRPDDIEKMRRLYASGWYSYEQLAADFGVTIGSAIRAIKGVGRYGRVGRPIPRPLTHRERARRRERSRRPRK